MTDSPHPGARPALREPFEPSAMARIVSPSNLISVLIDATRSHGGDRGIVALFHAAFLGRPNASDLPDLAERLLASDYIAHCSTPVEHVTAQGLIASWRRLGAAVPDLGIAVAEMLQDGNRWIVRSSLTGTPMGRFLGIEPTGRSFCIQAIHIHRLEDGRIAESWLVEDWSGAMRQLTRD
ncbi:ester cyclase [Rubellimicrobium arenae]|uniref:ester cyclase n=1 Tax=Rubellimicrobium arenae TaxID=2817372 RepID=UPI001B309D5F|nr:ester cyclase [Rubellimicrobium arenae]